MRFVLQLSPQIALESGDPLPLTARALYTFAALVLAAICAAQNTTSPPAEEAPLGPFIGRYLDSAQTGDLQCPIRTYRAYDVRASSEDNLLYFAIGSAFVGQNPATFADRVATEALATGYRGEKYLAFDHWYRREQCDYDRQTAILGFDWDNRKYKYVSYIFQGVAILDENFEEVNLLADQVGTDLLVFRNGTSYYLLIALDHAYPGGARLLDVTDPTDVKYMREVTSIAEMAESFDGRIAILHNDNVLRIYTTDAIVSNTAPSFTFTPPDSENLMDLTTDGRRFYALVNSSGNIRLHMFTPSGDTYVESIAASSLSAWSVHYGAGYVVVPGPTGTSFFEVGDDGLTLAADARLTWYYESGTRRYLNNVSPLVAGDQFIAVVSANGVGDVFALDATDPLTIDQSFLPATIDAGDKTHLTVTITNPRAAPVMFDLAHTYASGLVTAAGTIPATTCGTTVTATSDGRAFSLSNARLAANANCTVTVILAAAIAGGYTNTIDAAAIVSIENTNATESTATLVVVAPSGPASLSAVANGTSSVALTWGEVTGATAYEIFRNDVHVLSTTGTAAVDDTVSANTSYVYKVRAVGGGFSNTDLATTVAFTDSALAGAVAKAAHITELRTAITAVHTLAGLGPATFTDDPVLPGMAIKATHINELRSRLDTSRAALGLPPLTYGALSTIRAADISELRAGTQ